VPDRTELLRFSEEQVDFWSDGAFLSAPPAASSDYLTLSCCATAGCRFGGVVSPDPTLRLSPGTGSSTFMQDRGRDRCRCLTPISQRTLGIAGSALGHHLRRASHGPSHAGRGAPRALMLSPIADHRLTPSNGIPGCDHRGAWCAIQADRDPVTVDGAVRHSPAQTRSTSPRKSPMADAREVRPDRRIRRTSTRAGRDG
jgi:hypothetical protein